MKKGIVVFVFFILGKSISIGQANEMKLDWDIGNKKSLEETVQTKKVEVKLVGQIETVHFIYKNKDHKILDLFKIELIEKDKAIISFDSNGVPASFEANLNNGSLTLGGADPDEDPTLTLKFNTGHDPDYDSSSILSGVTLFKKIVNDQNPCDSMKTCNALLILDGASFVSNVSRLYRKNKDRKCIESSCWGCKHTLKVGDMLKVYIENFNAYLYDIEFSNQFMDVNYGEIGKIENGKTTETIPMGGDIQSTIKKYAKASKELKNFLDLMMMNRNPDSKLLIEQKKQIYHNVYQVLKIDPGLNVESLYKELKKEEQTQLKSDYDQARNLHVLFYQVMNLSYTHEITVIPIQIRSYDHLSLTIKIRDKKDKSLIREQEYIIPIRGGWKYDQSYGVVLHKINDQQYSLRDSIENGTLMGRVIMEEERNNLSFGFSTLQHMTYRLTGQFSFGPHIGISADLFPSTDLRYLFGSGISFRDERFKLHLNGGLIFGKYKSVDNINKLVATTDLPTFTDKFTTSYYLGMSFNIKFDLKNEQTATTEVKTAK